MVDSVNTGSHSANVKFTEVVKVKGKAQYICIASYCTQPTSKALRYSNALSRDHTVLPAHPRVLSADGMNHTCLCKI